MLLSETALEELRCRVLGDLLEEGIVAKLADYLYCEADAPKQPMVNFVKGPSRLNRCDLKLAASKTVIAPRKTTILWTDLATRNFSARTYQTASLASCERPTKLKAMRSLIGAYKVISRVIDKHLLIIQF